MPRGAGGRRVLPAAGPRVSGRQLPRHGPAASGRPVDQRRWIVYYRDSRHVRHRGKRRGSGGHARRHSVSRKSSAGTRRAQICAQWKKGTCELLVGSGVPERIFTVPPEGSRFLMRWQPTLDRTMIIAPHPDDDVIAAGGLIQRIIEGGGEVSVVYVTDGENNPWPQRYMKRKWILGAEDRAEWGAMRRREALASLERLRVSKDLTRFLAFPDQKISALARRGDMRLRDELRGAIESFRPTLIVSPSASDLHGDHRAIA